MEMWSIKSGIAIAIFLGMASAQPPPPTNCSVKDLSFELLTGWMYSAPYDILETKAGTVLLTECIDSCKMNSSCESINFETGLCVLFKTQAGDGSEGLVKSQFPVFTMFAQKICMPSGKDCNRAWGFEIVRGYHIKDAGKKATQHPTRQGCMEACNTEKEFPCRSASWNPKSLECTLSEMDRYRLGVSPRFEMAEDVIYMESQCVQEPSRMCEFKRIEHRLLKAVDAIHEGVSTIDECRQLCLTAPFRCHTFDFEGVCRLSHHATATVTHVQDPYLQMNGSYSFERGACYNVTLGCQPNHMLATLQTSKVFNGKLYSRHRPNSCVLDVTENSLFEMQLDYSDPACGVKQDEPGQYSVDLVLQHHDRIMTSSDLGFALKCSFELENRSVSYGVELQVNGQIPFMASEIAAVSSPNVTMSITDRDGGDLSTAQVGDRLALRFEIIDLSSPYEIFVRELIAMDGADGAEIVLIDSRGCPTDTAIMGPVTQIDEGKNLQAFFETFKFPTSDVVQFLALVSPCIPTCPPVNCSVPEDVQSYGRRRRRSTRNTSNESDNELLVVKSIRIADRFQFDKNGRKLPKNGSEDVSWRQKDTTKKSSSDQCMSMFGFLLFCTVAVLIQIALIFAWLYNSRRERAASKELSLGSGSHSLPKPTQHIFSPTPSLSSSSSLSSVQPKNPLAQHSSSSPNHYTQKCRQHSHSKSLSRSDANVLKDIVF